MEVPWTLVVVLVLTVAVSGCVGSDAPGDATEDGNGMEGNGSGNGDGNVTADVGAGDDADDEPGENDTDTGTEASYEQTEHTGCQPGAINKDGSCTVAFSGQNAEIFGARNLTPITATNTTLGGTPGYLARPADNGTYPAVVMIHEWWGLNDNIRHMADVLAGHGYTVFAADLYDGEVATEAGRAAELSGRVRDNPDEAVTKLSRATDALRSSRHTTQQVASLGWCFGGGWSLQLSLSDADLNGTVIYYGTLTTEEDELRDIDAPVLGIFGSEDQVVGPENVEEFDRTLDEIGVENEVQVYDGAEHAFANPSGESFRPNATRDAWDRTLGFLDSTLKG
jgi:carboxymethylenebutenolidase